MIRRYTSAYFEMRAAEFERQWAILDGRCAYCGQTLARYRERMKAAGDAYFFSADCGAMDHVHGAHEAPENLLLCCKRCNSMKNNRSINWLRAYRGRKFGSATLHVEHAAPELWKRVQRAAEELIAERGAGRAA